MGASPRGRRYAGKKGSSEAWRVSKNTIKGVLLDSSRMIWTKKKFKKDKGRSLWARGKFIALVSWRKPGFSRISKKGKVYEGTSGGEAFGRGMLASRI